MCRGISEILLVSRARQLDGAGVKHVLLQTSVFSREFPFFSVLGKTVVFLLLTCKDAFTHLLYHNLLDVVFLSK